MPVQRGPVSAFLLIEDVQLCLSASNDEHAYRTVLNLDMTNLWECIHSMRRLTDLGQACTVALVTMLADVIVRPGACCLRGRVLLLLLIAIFRVG